MPAKKKTAKKLSRRLSRKAVVVDGIPLSEMTKEQLEEHVIRLREELEREREERNYFQAEQDKLSSFWSISRGELDKKSSQVCLLQQEIGQMQEQHQKEIAVFKQKTKHLEYEHQKKSSELRVEGQIQMKSRDRERVQMEENQSKEVLGLRSKIKELELAHLGQTRDLRMKHNQDLSKAIAELDDKLKEAEKNYEERLQKIREESDVQRSTQVLEVEERKGAQLEEVQRNNREALDQLKTYYNDVTQNNMALINSMKDQIEALTTKEEQREKAMQKLQEENRNLKEPFKEAKLKLAAAQLRLGTLEKAEVSFTKCQYKMKMLTKETRELKLENERLLQRCNKLEKERNSLYSNFTSSIQEVRQQCDLKASLLEKKAQDLEELLNKIQQ